MRKEPLTLDQQMKKMGKVVKFGGDQLNNPTPQTAKVVFRTILFLSALWAVAAPQVTELSPLVLAAINKYLILAVALVNVTIKFWGWDFPTDSNK